ncbi:hypothetical protein TNCV_1658931 [Trichonephila clavipes]|nr:hypothetical protein TNCV_1658931 [Trichonephila clavipes]
MHVWEIQGDRSSSVCIQYQYKTIGGLCPIVETCQTSSINKITIPPALSPIENIWSRVTERLASQPYPANTVDELWYRLEAAWNESYISGIQAQFDSMPSGLLQDYMQLRPFYVRDSSSSLRPAQSPKQFTAAPSF